MEGSQNFLLKFLLFLFVLKGNNIGLRPKLVMKRVSVSFRAKSRKWVSFRSIKSTPTFSTSLEMIHPTLIARFSVQHLSRFGPTPIQLLLETERKMLNLCDPSGITLSKETHLSESDRQKNRKFRFR